jgi:hypothetical protein
MKTDFEFVYGSWNVHNRKLRDTLDDDCDEWIEFESRSEVGPILDGWGHIERIYFAPTADDPAPEGFTLRLFDPTTDRWRIWWSATAAPGVLDTPVEGSFTDGRGVFESRDVLGGRPARVRFEWLTADPDRPVWQQSFSFDDGVTWRRNWVMTFVRQ